MNYFDFRELPIGKKMLDFWNNNGFLVIENFYSKNECVKLRDRANFLIENFDKDISEMSAQEFLSRFIIKLYHYNKWKMKLK